jgi:hypothetical protein
MKKYKDWEIMFCEELQKDLLKGAVVVWSRKAKFIATILIRLPKDKLEQAPTNSGEVVGWEYKQYNQSYDYPMHLTNHRNGTKRTVIKTTKADHLEAEYEESRAYNMQEKLGRLEL